MRTPSRVLAAAALGVVVLVPSTGSAAEPPAGEAVQKQAGTIAVPNPTKAAGTNVSRGGRTLGLVDPRTNGVHGWFIKVDEKSWGGEFVLTTTTAGADLDVIFYSDPGTLTDPPAATAEFVGSDGDGERGVIPATTTHALVYAAGRPAAAFSYVGHAAPKVLLGAGPLDITVPAGGTVEFVNDTGGESFVTSTGATKPTQFPSKTLAAGESHRVSFARAGAFPYETSAGTGTVTVR